MIVEGPRGHNALLPKTTLFSPCAIRTRSRYRISTPLSIDSTSGAEHLQRMATCGREMAAQMCHVATSEQGFRLPSSEQPARDLRVKRRSGLGFEDGGPLYSIMH